MSIKSDQWIVWLVIVNVVLSLWLVWNRSSISAPEEYEDDDGDDGDDQPKKNWRNCQSNGYTEGCVWGAYSGGTQYDYPSFCS